MLVYLHVLIYAYVERVHVFNTSLTKLEILC